MLTLTHVTKRYGDHTLFSGLNLQVQSGEFVALLGESGMGKSTLLNCMAGLDSLNGGEVRLLDTRLSHLPEAEQALFRRRHLGFIFQAFHVLAHLSVANNVALPLLLLGRPDPARVAEALASVGLDDLGNRLPQTLSGGQLQRVAIARALVHRPQLILADEPTGNLDPRTARKVLDVLVDQVRLHQAACVLVTHSHAAAARADRVLELTPDGIQPAKLSGT